MSQKSEPPSPEKRDDYSYEAFGRDFFEQAVTQSRVEKALSNLTGDAIDFGPREVGPGGLASIKAHGEVREPLVTRREGDLIRFDLAIPIYLELTVRLAAHDHRFHADMRARLQLTARAKKPLHIFIDVPPPTKDDVEVKVRAQGIRASVLDIVADVDGELRRYVARYIARQIDKPGIRKMRDIDVRERLAQPGPEADG